MASGSPVHDYLLPRLTALVDETVATGVARDVAVAVLIDLITSPGFDTAAPDPRPDTEPHDLWRHGPGDVVLTPGLPNVPLPLDARDEADFVKPIGWFGET